MPTLRFAGGLGVGSIPAAAAPFAFTLVAPDPAPQHRSGDTMCLAPERTVNRERQPPGLCVSVTEEPYEPESFPQPLTVAGIPLTRDDVVRSASGNSLAR